MRLCILSLIVCLFAACAGGGNSPSTNSAAPDNAKAERKKQIALQNEVTNITTAAQKFEKLGRGMDLLRKVSNPNSQRECVAQMEDNQRQVADLETRINNLPDAYKIQLSPITGDLKECVSCEKTAMESCVKSRAATNDAIQKLFPQ